MNHLLIRALAGSAALCLVACQRTEYTSQAQGSTSSGLSSVPGTATPSSIQVPDGWCPFAMPGTQVRAEDTPDGASLVFTTTGDAAAVRSRVRQMAEHHNQMANDAGPMGGRGKGPSGARGVTDAGAAPPPMGPFGMGEGMTGGGRERDRTMRGGMMGWVPSQASVEDVPGGARLTLVPTSPADLQPLRIRTQWHAQRMATGPCAMGASEPAPDRSTSSGP
jgi:hypothetical protein